MKQFTVLIFTLLFLISCMGKLVTVHEVDVNTIEKIVSYDDKEILTNKNTIIIGPLEATSCQHLLWDEVASEENCINQLKMKTYSLSGNGLVIGDSYESQAEFVTKKGINRNCWTSVDCSGVAIITK